MDNSPRAYHLVSMDIELNLCSRLIRLVSNLCFGHSFVSVSSVSHKISAVVPLDCLPKAFCFLVQAATFLKNKLARPQTSIKSVGETKCTPTPCASQSSRQVQIVHRAYVGVVGL